MTADATLPTVLPRRRVHRGVGLAAPARRDHRGSRGPAVTDPAERVRAALSEVAEGRPVVLVDDDGGDLVIAAERAAPQVVSFVVRHTSGFVRVAVPEDDADRLDLPLMVRTDRNRPGAAQCVAVDAAGGGTGISAADRAATIRLLAAPDTVASDLVRPGHVIPLRVGADGLLGCRGRAEAALDLASLAGLRPSSALCELVSTTDPRGMARGPELDRFARQHGLQLVSVSDLAAYRMRFDQLVERGARATMPLTAGHFTAVGYRSRLDGAEHLALVHGEIGDGEDVLVRVHRECLTGDILGSARCGCGGRLQSALARVADEGRGVVVYLRSGQGDAGLLAELVAEPYQEAGDQLSVTIDDGVHGHGIGRQILRDLGVHSTRLDSDLLVHRCAAAHG